MIVRHCQAVRFMNEFRAIFPVLFFEVVIEVIRYDYRLPLTLVGKVTLLIFLMSRSHVNDSSKLVEEIFKVLIFLI